MDQKTPEIRQLASKEMREVEILADDSLPLSLDDRDRVGLASKSWQIGAAACQAILEGITTGLNPEPPAIVIVDLFARNGDMAEAFCKFRLGRSNAFYFGFTESQDELTYIHSRLKDSLAESYEGGAPTPTGEKVEQSISADLVESLPPKPRMNVLVTWLFQFLVRIVGSGFWR